MRTHVRNAIVLLVAIGLVALFLRNVDLWRVGADIVRARPEWLALSLTMMTANLAIRALRWQYLLDYFGRGDEASDPCGHCDNCEAGWSTRRPGWATGSCARSASCRPTGSSRCSS